MGAAKRPPSILSTRLPDYEHIVNHSGCGSGHRRPSYHPDATRSIFDSCVWEPCGHVTFICAVLYWWACPRPILSKVPAGEHRAVREGDICAQLIGARSAPASATAPAISDVICDAAQGDPPESPCEAREQPRAMTVNDLLLLDPPKGVLVVRSSQMRKNGCQIRN